jgi:NAD(P)-dependent dehydrogenase (short-subunit alcohol dehydrogenase family)
MSHALPPASIQADSTKMADLNRLYAQVKADSGRIDILFANAGGDRT